MPAPKLAIVAPCTKFVNSPVSVADTLCPTWPEFDTTDEIEAGGLMVSVALFDVLNWTLPAVMPVTDTRYAVGVATTIDAGIRNANRRVLPVRVVTAVGMA